MSIEIDVDRIDAEGCEGKVKNFNANIVTAGLISDVKLHLQEFRNIDKDCQDDWRENVCEEVDSCWVPQLMSPVV